MSTNKKWRVLLNRNKHGAETAALAGALGLLEPTAVLLYNRGLVTPELARKFLDRDEIRFHDPFLLDDMDKACERIERALANGERIVIYGDYDVDGVTSVSTLLLYLRSRGADAGYYIPNRAGEGYGINSAALEQLAGEGYTLVVTVDTGITAIAEIELARSLGMDVIVTDHHECPAKLPDAVAVVNPKRAGSRYPFTELAASAWCSSSSPRSSTVGTMASRRPALMAAVPKAAQCQSAIPRPGRTPRHADAPLPA